MKDVIKILMLILSISYACSNDDVPLENTLKSDSLGYDLRTQVGTYLPFLLKEGNMSSHFSYKDSGLIFKGFGIIESSHDPKFLEIKGEDDAPSFMFTFKKRGDSIEIGGDVKGINLKNWNEYLAPKNQ